MATGGNDAESVTCAVCLEIYRDPKFLPCHHTFCAQCITGVANRHTGGTFPCPSCREPASLPKGGVAALQANFYLKKQSENSKEMCKIHTQRELEFYCVRCQEAICINCKMTKHEQHQTEDLHTAIQQKHKELLTDKSRLQKAVRYVTRRVKTTRVEQQAVLDKKAAVEKNIRDRHAVMVAAADKFRDEALDSLRSVSTDIDSDIAQILEQQEGDMEKLLDIQRQVERACNSGRASDVITAVREMKRGSKQAVKKLTSQGLKTVCRPVLHFKITGDVMLQKTRDFMGTVTKMEMEVAAPEVRVVKRFPCGQEAGIEVFSLCHVDKDPPGVWVSYERCQLKKDAPVKLYSEDGQYKQSMYDSVNLHSTDLPKESLCAVSLGQAAMTHSANH
ncbi:tripartite motif-containing protein 3-like [Littorina saxatilis]|uniref:tripartite motif-containing protein 3-like n=1 Tax=Littorina saxatilis TaxID=31220 RepID=UPI0038B56092